MKRVESDRKEKGMEQKQDGANTQSITKPPLPGNDS